MPGTMENSIHHLVAVLCGKCLLNWAVLLVQRRYIMKSLLGFLCTSLALVDFLLALLFLAIFFLQDVRVFGLRLTTHHICLLVQIACFTYSILHWPLFFLMGLDRYWNLSLHPRPLRWAQKLGYTLSVCFIWVAALLYVAFISGFYPNFGKETYLLLYRCWVFCSPQSSQISVLLLMTLACTLMYGCPTTLTPVTMVKGMSDTQLSARVGPLSNKCVAWMVLGRFLNTWTPYVALQAALLLLPVAIPTYLDLNIPWLCLLNSFWTFVVLLSRSQELSHEEQLTYTDGFCLWNFGSELADCGKRQST